jgi:hypothetical protein
MAHVLVSPLNWGLGHATRDIPVIAELLAHNHEVTVAASGNALNVLKKEFPSIQFIDFPDYPIWYSGNRFFLPKFVASFPLILRALSDERRKLAGILEKNRYDLIISDNRLGVYSQKVPSVFISHQLHYHLPLMLWPAELLGIWMNGFLHSKFKQIIVPDNPPGPLSLAGKLSRPGTDETRSRAYFAGILTSTCKREIQADLDYLVMISGPEPQRTRLEEILLPQVSDLDGKCVVLLGSPGSRGSKKNLSNGTVIPFATTEEKEILMNRAKFVICRSGYTTVMELAELGKKQALFIPTPGQTEQEYLSWYYEQKNWFHSKSQYDLDLTRDIAGARQYSGFPPVPTTAGNVGRLYREMLAGYLE